MSLLTLGKLAKLKIKAYKDRERKSSVGDFEVMYNPTSITQKYEIAYGKAQSMASTGISAKYMYSKPRELKLDLILDGTKVENYGITLFKKQKTVTEQVNELLDLTYRMSSSTHEPAFLTIAWGELDWGEQFKANVFSCRLASADITYTHFNRDGSPFRAKLAVTFISDIEVLKRLRQEKKSSPDLTHVRVVKSGDTLPLLSKEIYGSSKYYLKLAEVNNLDSFRNLVPGQQLLFPPLAKEGLR